MTQVEIASATPIVLPTQRGAAMTVPEHGFWVGGQFWGVGTATPAPSVPVPGWSTTSNLQFVGCQIAAVVLSVPVPGCSKLLSSPQVGHDQRVRLAGPAGKGYPNYATDLRLFHEQRQAP